MKFTVAEMQISPADFEVLGFVLRQGAAKVETLAYKYPPKSVRRMIDNGYLQKFGRGYVGLSKKGRQAITLSCQR